MFIFGVPKIFENLAWVENQDFLLPKQKNTISLFFRTVKIMISTILLGKSLRVFDRN